MYSGERILPKSIFNVTYQQSLKAYELAAQLASGKSVLDVACGEGYGTSLLARSAAEAVGVDYHRETVRRAQQKYGNASLSYMQGNLFDLASILRGKKFDVVCCFQTIEHVQDHDAFIRALRSALKPGGTLIVSTPNKKIFPSFNPYHVHELDYDEMNSLFCRYFSDVAMYGVFGNSKVMAYRASKQVITDRVLGLDRWRLRERLPAALLKIIYAVVSFFVIKQFSFWRHRQAVVDSSTADFTVSQEGVERALDLLCVARS
jgi:ubiquinone/menaquinone biosynthesis C-methylase UbiE